MSDDVSLREYLESRFAGFGQRLDAYVNQHREMHEKLAEQVAQSAVSVDKRLEDMNALRAQIMSERGQFVTRDMMDQRSMAVDLRFQEFTKRFDQRFEDQASRIADIERSKANLDGRFSMLAMVLSGLVVVMTIAINYLMRGH